MILLDNYKNGENYLVTKEEPLTIITHKIDKEINFTCEVKEGATLNIYNVITTTNDVSLNEEVNITGQNAHVEVINVLLGKNNQIKSLVKINHLEKNSESEFSNYAIALENTKMVLDNNATIKKGAHKSVVHQKAKGLTLDKTASIKAQPNLFIDDFDVVASHACSIGSINQDDLFYLTSRGLSTVDATKLIVVGFIKPILDKIDDESVVNAFMNDFIQILENK